MKQNRNNEISEQLLEIYDIVEKTSNERIPEYEKKITKFTTKLDELNYNIKRNKKEVVKRMTCILASATVLMGVVVGSFKLSKPLAKETTYETTNEKYISPGEFYKNEVNYEKSLKRNPSIYYVVHESVDKQNNEDEKKKITTYDVSKFEFEDVKDYATIDLKENEIMGSTEFENHNPNFNQTYDLLFIEIVKKTQNIENFKTNINEIHQIICFISCLLFLLCGERLLQEYKLSPIVKNYKKLQDALCDLDVSKNYKVELLSEIQELLYKLNYLVYNNAELKKKFLNIYHNNVGSITDSDLKSKCKIIQNLK